VPVFSRLSDLVLIERLISLLRYLTNESSSIANFFQYWGVTLPSAKAQLIEDVEPPKQQLMDGGHEYQLGDFLLFNGPMSSFPLRHATLLVNAKATLSRPNSISNLAIVGSS